MVQNRAPAGSEGGLCRKTPRTESKRDLGQLDSEREEILGLQLTFEPHEDQGCQPPVPWKTQV